MKKPIRVKDIDELKKYANHPGGDFFISMGILRSSYYVNYQGEDKWYVSPMNGDKEFGANTNELNDKSNLIDAMGKGALWFEP